MLASAVPQGWESDHGCDSRQSCLDYIDEQQRTRTSRPWPGGSRW
ncbi:MbtH family NRPS accessory protein [Streptomyces sp. NPDC093097]